MLVDAMCPFCGRALRVSGSGRSGVRCRGCGTHLKVVDGEIIGKA